MSQSDSSGGSGVTSFANDASLNKFLEKLEKIGVPKRGLRVRDSFVDKFRDDCETIFVRLGFLTGNMLSENIKLNPYLMFEICVLILFVEICMETLIKEGRKDEAGEKAMKERYAWVKSVLDKSPLTSIKMYAVMITFATFLNGYNTFLFITRRLHETDHKFTWQGAITVPEYEETKWKGVIIPQEYTLFRGMYYWTKDKDEIRWEALYFILNLLYEMISNDKDTPQKAKELYFGNQGLELHLVLKMAEYIWYGSKPIKK